MKITSILAGCFVAYTIGANNVANSIGPVLDARILTFHECLLIGAVPMGIGTLLFGNRVMSNMGFNIIHFSSYDALIVSLAAGMIILAASILGMPMPTAQVFALSIVGVRQAKSEMLPFMSGKTTRKIIIFLAVSPIVSMVTSFSAIFIFYRFFI